MILGPCAGGAVYSPALTDFVFMVKGTSHMFITGPDVVKTVTGEDVTQEELGGAMTHASKSGVAAFVYDDEQHCLEQVRYLLSFLPSNNLEDPPYYETDDPADRSCDGIIDLIPDAPNQPYDMKKVIAEVVDDGEFLEVYALWADEHRVRVRPHRRSRRRHRRQPAAVLAGTLDIDASEKAARFVRTCDAFNVPLVTFVDVPGFLPGTDQEYGGIIRHGAKLLYAYCEATVPRVQVITRKAYGGAYVVMNSKSIGADLAFAWPSAEIAVMGAPGAVNLIFRKEIEAADDPEAKRAELIARVHRALRQPVRRRRAWLRRRRDRPARDPQGAAPLAGHAAHEARAAAVAQARERAAVSTCRSHASPEATPEEVAAILAAIARRNRRRVEGGRDDTPARVGARGPAPLAPRRSAARAVAPVGAHQHGAAALDGPAVTRRRPRRAHQRRPRRGRRDVHDARRRSASPRVVGDHEVTTEGPFHDVARRRPEPDTEYELAVEGVAPDGRWLPAHGPHARAARGRLLATLATANDVHFGETECGRRATPPPTPSARSCAPRRATRRIPR